MPNTYVALRTETVTGSPATSVTFSLTGISGYTDLVLVINGTNTTSAQNVGLRFNGDTTSLYSRTAVYGDGTSALSTRDSNQTSIFAYYYGTTQATAIIQIMNYSNTTTFKTIISRSNDTASAANATVGLYRSTSAITSLTVIPLSTTFAVGSTFSLYGIANADQGNPKATGGIITEDSTYWYHTFGASGAFTPKQALTVEYVVIAGGGGGGCGRGGGGGAGGYRSSVIGELSGGGASAESVLSVASGTPLTVTIGAGGPGAGSYPGGGTSGVNSVFGSITSTGGGGGAGGTGFNGLGGGSGGGAAGFNPTFTTIGTGTANQGFNGGGGNNGGSGGGGGGAGSVGGTGGANGGNGGNGLASIVSGFLVSRGGGGGGAGEPVGTVSAGGGAGSIYTGSPNATAGTTNTGGGGGGGAAGSNVPGAGGAGGSGIVIVRYPK
jgi:hypothetical protein